MSGGGFPRVVVSGVAYRGRSGCGFDWGPGDRRNSGCVAEGAQTELVATLTGIKRVLQTADSYGDSYIVIVINRKSLAECINKREEHSDEYADDLLDWIYSNPVNFSMEYLDLKKEEFRSSLRIARKFCGTHSKANNKVRDSMFSKGVLKVSVYGASDYGESFERGASGVFFDNGSNMNSGEQLDDLNCNYEVQMKTLENALDIALTHQFREIRVRTKSFNIYKIINFFNKHRNLKKLTRKANPELIQNLAELMSCFDKITVASCHRMRKDYGIGQARKLALMEFLEGGGKDGMYREKGIRVIYTDGACSHNGQHGARAGAGIFWGPEDKRNEKCGVSGEQTNNRAEYTAVLRAMEIAQNHGIDRLIIRTDSDLLCKSINFYIKKWRENGWTKYNGQPVKNQDLLKAIDRLKGRMEVDLEYIAGHSNHEGNDGADRLAKEAARGEF